jgi:hydroxymethylpyrimidine pyrophosphatase-like HAD family hydrolase
MRYLVLATDYDGTLAGHGRVGENTLEALKNVLSSGTQIDPSHWAPPA